jgi:SAM-dependent methyltransferase
MPHVLYCDLTPWYRLVDPPEDHLDEAIAFSAAIERASTRRPETLLELGAGAGHNALNLKERFRCTFTDLSPEMQALSRELNPECEHHLGDMRTLRLGRTFDAVLLHDAVMYMTTEADLRAAIQTAFEHTRPGGVALFVPDIFRETFHEFTELLTCDRDGRSLRGLMWSHDPDPSDSTFITDFAFLIRDGGETHSFHDRHIEGIFSLEQWRALFTDVGYEVDTFERPLGDGAFDEVFLCRRPA